MLQINKFKQQVDLLLSETSSKLITGLDELFPETTKVFLEKVTDVDVFAGRRVFPPVLPGLLELQRLQNTIPLIEIFLI